MKINRKLYKQLATFTSGRINVLYGPRRVGKTVMVKEILDLFSGKKIYLTGDDEGVKEVFGSNNLTKILEYASDFELVVIDEAQRVPDIGWGLKLLIDARPDIKVIVTGSASFELAGQVGEPLTGRKFEHFMYPISLQEISKNGLSSLELKRELSNYLIYGIYPDVVTEPDKTVKQKLLDELLNSLLLKDILELERIKNSKILLDLLRLLAYQIGSEVSQTELASNLGIDYKTVGKYLDLLEKSFIVFSLRGFSKNLRKEVNKMSKYYFYDNGIRNALISNFNPLDIRNDIGILWENFLIAERLKFQSYNDIRSNNYFWRTWDQEEIDWIEEREGKLFAYEFKYNPKKTALIPKSFKETYIESTFEVVTEDNYLDWLI